MRFTALLVGITLRVVGLAILLAALLVAGALACHAQSVSPVVNPTVVIADHPQHADYHELRPETPLVSSGVTVATGERPLSDFPEKHPWVPLGDVAREYREHRPVKREKATVIP